MRPTIDYHELLTLVDKVDHLVWIKVSGKIIFLSVDCLPNLFKKLPAGWLASLHAGRFIDKFIALKIFYRDIMKVWTR